MVNSATKILHLLASYKRKEIVDNFVRNWNDKAGTAFIL